MRLAVDFMGEHRDAGFDLRDEGRSSSRSTDDLRPDCRAAKRELAKP